MKNNIQIWKTIQLRAHSEISEYLKSIADNGFQVDRNTEYAVSRNDIQVSKENKEIDLIVLTVAELGYKYATYREVYLTGMLLGLELCVTEVAFALREQYKDQPLSEQINIAMQPIIADEKANYFHFFTVTNNEKQVYQKDILGPALNLKKGAYIHHMYDADERFLFCGPR